MYLRSLYLAQAIDPTVGPISPDLGLYDLLVLLNPAREGSSVHRLRHAGESRSLQLSDFLIRVVCSDADCTHTAVYDLQ